MGKVKFNICNVHIAPHKERALTGELQFDTIIPLPGAVSISLEPKGKAEPFYADGIEYYKAEGSMGYEGELEVAEIPDDFRIKILKEVLDSKQVMLEQAGVETNKFAIGLQIDGNEKNTRFWFYNSSAERLKTASKTNEESKTPQTDNLKFSASPEKVVKGSEDLFVRSKTTDKTDPETYNNWFKQVYIPTLSLPAKV